ncbi:kinesin [Fusarium beomiforme]|uniref:Kinesin n=1 Tax=Fusarium beomiforme TaxID=44412 RepID=A0A9P5ABB0_9HYPO|nr:kinesin [Fusarium beomiforme]
MNQLKSDIKRLRRKNASQQWYIPERALLEFMTEDAINNTLAKSSVPSHQHAETLQRILEGGRRIYAILVLLDFYQYLTNFIEGDQLDDGKLPFTLETLSHSLEIPSEDAKDFEDKQWELIAPVFRRGTLNRRLEQSFVLPFNQDKRIGKGAFGTVYEVVLDPDHQILSGEFFPGIVARKEFHTKDSHQKELENLSILNHLKHANIVELLGSFTRSDTYSLFFPLASDGNLHDVLLSSSKAELFASTETMLVSLAALSSAIEHVHDFSKQNMIDLELIGCHHDLRPRNILVSGSKLILADFGLSTLKPSSQNSETPFKHNGDDYLAPECEDWDNSFLPGNVHRSADIWSFGCIIAEVLTFLVSGRTGIEEFRQQRKHKVRNWTFYQFHQGLGRPSNAVNEWLSRLEAARPTASTLLAGIIRQMLAMNQAARLTAKDVTRKLRYTAIYEVAVSIDSLYKHIKQSAPCIDISLEHERFHAWMHATSLDKLKDYFSTIRHGESDDRDTMAQYDSILESLHRLREDLQDRLSRGPHSRRLDLSRLIRLQDELHCFLSRQQQNASQAYFRISVLSSGEIPLKGDHGQTVGALSHEIRMRANIRYINNLLAAMSVDGSNSWEARLGSGLPKRATHLDHSRIPNLKPIHEHHYGSGLLEKSDSDAVVSRPVWVEWRKYQHHGANEETIDKLYSRAAQTADLLSQNKPESFRTLTCLGLFHEPARAAFGIVFEFPPYSGARGVVTLHHRLQANTPSNNKTRPTAVPDLDDKFKLAATLAASLFELHTVGWLHKSLKSSNVVFFPPSTTSESQNQATDTSNQGTYETWTATSQLIRHPYLVGFNHSRPDDPMAFTSGLADQESRHYQHPAYLKAGTGYRMEFDYYSLGILLLEIGFWKPLSKITQDWTGSFEDRRQKLLTNRVPKLAQHMGRDYSEAITDESFTFEDDEISLGESFLPQGRLSISLAKHFQTADKCLFGSTHSTFLSSRLFSSADVSPPSKSSPEWNLITFLAVVQKLNIQILPVTWEPRRQLIGRGGTSQINQSLITLQASFAFKRVSEQDRLNKPEKDIYRCLINEMLILCHPRVRGHQNILELQGICWDVSPKNKNETGPGAQECDSQYSIWPVLVFEKSQFGDLSEFASHPMAPKLTMMERWEICLNIGNAIAHMQSNTYEDVIHGDIKPQNILIFKRDDAFSAKVADFGYSAWYAPDDKNIVLPRSPLWHAPEIDEYPEFSSEMALKTDVYSFGLLEHSLDSLYSSDYRVRSCIRQRLEQMVRSKPSSPLLQQLKFCYRLEFGRPDSGTQVLCVDGIQDIHVPSPKSPPGALDPRASVTLFQQLVRDGYLSTSESLVQKYVNDGVLETAQLTIEADIESLGNIPGTWFLVGLLKTSLSFIFCAQGQWNKAEKMEIELMGGRASALSDSNPVSLIRTLNLASIYDQQGLSKKAEDLSLRAMEVANKILDNEHPDKQQVMLTLASVYWSQDRWNEAYDLQRRVIEIRKRTLGRDHPNTLRSMEELATTYWAQGHWIEAEKYTSEIVEISKTVLDPADPHFLGLLSSLATIYRDIGWWAKAQELEAGILTTRLRVSGREHPSTLASMVNLAASYEKRGQTEEAEQLVMDALKISERTRGPEHPNTLSTAMMLASILQSQDDLEQAEELMIKTIESFKRLQGQNHSLTLTAMESLCSLYLDQARWEEAEALGKEVVDASKQRLGEEHPRTLMTISTSAKVYRDQGKWDIAEKIDLKVLQMAIKTLGEEHPETMIIMANLAVAYWGLDKFEEAEALEIKVLEMKRRILGNGHPSTLTSIDNLAATYVDLGRWAEAEALELEALTTRAKTVGQDFSCARTTPETTALLWWGDEDAESTWQTVIETRERILGKDHYFTINTMERLLGKYEEDGRLEDSAQLGEKIRGLKKTGAESSLCDGARGEDGLFPDYMEGSIESLRDLGLDVKIKYR